MRGDPRAIFGRLSTPAPRRRSSWIAEAIQQWRHVKADRLEVIERLAREERRARQRGQYVPEVKYRVQYRVRQL
jgi:hypothetical protein